MPFTKTEVDIHDDYVVETVDAAWLATTASSAEPARTCAPGTASG